MNEAFKLAHLGIYLGRAKVSMGSIIFGTAVSLLVFIFPAAAALVEHSASTILALLTLMGLWALIARRKKTDTSRTEKAVMIAFAAYFVISACFMLLHGVLPNTPYPEWKLGHEARMLAFVPVFYLFLRTDLKSGAFWYGVCAGAIVNGIYACVVIFFLQGGIAIGAYNPIVFGDASMALSFMSLAGLGFFAKKHGMLSIIPLMAAALGLAAPFLSGTRGAIVAAPLLLVVFLVQAGGYPRPWVIRSAVVSMLVVLALAGYFMPSSSLDERLHRGMDTAVKFATGQETRIKAAADRSTAVRLQMWSDALEIFRDNPWTGIGKIGFKTTINERARANEDLSSIKDFDTPHNMYLTSLTSYGVIGLAMLLGIFVGPLLLFIRCIRLNPAARDAGYAGVMLVLAYMQFALTESVFWRTVPIAIYLILTAAMMALCRTIESRGETPAQGHDAKTA